MRLADYSSLGSRRHSCDSFHGEPPFLISDAFDKSIRTPRRTPWNSALSLYRPSTYHRISLISCIEHEESKRRGCWSLDTFISFDTLMKATFTLVLFGAVWTMALARTLYANQSSNADIICPDAVSLCPSTSTCCIATDGDYSCCPIQNGVCCSDHVHCCPQHYKCDLKIFKCDRVFSAKLLSLDTS